MSIPFSAVCPALSLVFSLVLVSSVTAAPATPSESVPPAASEHDRVQEKSAPGYNFQRIKKTRSFEMNVGKKALIHLGAVRNYGVLDKSVVSIEAHPDGDKIVVLAKTPGTTTIGVGRIGFEVTVQSAPEEQTVAQKTSPPASN